MVADSDHDANMLLRGRHVRARSFYLPPQRTPRTHRDERTWKSTGREAKPGIVPFCRLAASRTSFRENGVKHPGFAQVLQPSCGSER